MKIEKSSFYGWELSDVGMVREATRIIMEDTVAISIAACVRWHGRLKAEKWLPRWPWKPSPHFQKLGAHFQESNELHQA